MRARLRATPVAILLLCLSAVAVADESSVAAESQKVTAALAIDQAELLSYLAGQDPFVLIDARSVEEFDSGHIYQAINIPHDQLTAHSARLPTEPGAAIVIYCKTGMRAAKLQAQLLDEGYTNVRILGPSQLIWSSSAPMFNCGVPSTEPSDFFLPSAAESN